MEIVEKLPMPQKEKENIISQTVTSYGGKLMSFIRPKVKNTEDAEDILQEVWYQFSSLTNLSEIVNVGGWLYRVTANKITDKYRKKKTENLEDFVYEDEDGTFSIKDILLLDDSAGPEVKMFQDEIWKKLFEALEELPEKQKLVYMENELNDKTLQQIADEQGENIKTIISRKNYAVKHLRNRLKQLYEDLNN
ncbi:sigma-70 family RNA polymerase sigma factor [Chryseobacterium indoltheticum]|jgi:RNA polymerase sigma factor (sigma-70 family)|uniref:RNA polymerase sigma factor sigV n=4 Tax=Chryseobacterium group TaxID=2782232 RepID=A0A381FR52_9FLAO|nr:sigma-70 family RNA polymerase sigma factor [Chryseobacterium indoltheticum]AZB28777.1 sigma-70 family RNA polymerase sigma factor [Chryseobacterium balustinum]REC40591.1 sigma-70 family RNA polymerase sigma factor [Chryseobacterium sp. 5_R23647]REC56902.1 sigma-70 family RNA polymerase sigma factor [Chryseobacterium piscium]AZA74891.1 sigma-70 family RNA polymerase sigma factor [Chryseobacterium indoltheticum]